MKVWGIAGASFLLVLMGGLAASSYFRPAPEDPAFAQLRTIEEEIEALEKSDNPQPNDVLVIEALRTAMAEQWEALPQEKKEARIEVEWEKGEAQREAWSQPRLAAFFALPPEERVAAINKLIDESEARRANWEGGGPPGERGGPPGQQGGNRGPRGGNQQRGGRPGRGSWVGTSSEKQKNRTRNQLNRTTPEYRAHRTEFVRLVQEQRRKKGLPPVPVRTAVRMFRELVPPPTS